MLTNAFDNDDGNVISTRYETNGKLSNLRRLQAKTKVKQAAARDLLFADDCALNTSTETMMQQSVGRFSTVCDNFGFIISTKKTKVMHQPAPQKMYEPPTITVKDETLEAVDEFTYLETHSQDLWTSTQRSTRALPRPAQPSDGFVKQFGKGEVSGYLVYVCDIWSVWTSRKRAQSLLPELPQKAAKYHVAWQSPWHRSPLSNWPAQYLHSAQQSPSQVGWPPCQNARHMPPPKKGSMVNLQTGSAHKVDRKNVTRILSKRHWKGLI